MTRPPKALRPLDQIIPVIWRCICGQFNNVATIPSQGVDSNPLGKRASGSAAYGRDLN